MNILEAARQYFNAPKDQTPEEFVGRFAAGTFYAGAAFGALAARMTQEEILKAVRELAPPARAGDPELRAVLVAALDFTGDFQNSKFQSGNPKWQALKAALAAALNEKGN